jgi:uncharacterized protein
MHGSEAGRGEEPGRDGGGAAERIRVDFEEFSILVELLESQTAREIRANLPFSSTVNRWGEEIYFATPVSVSLEPGAREVVDRGDVGYWPPGKALAIFFGPTPVSEGDECRAAGPVNVFGRVIGDLSRLSSVPAGSPVHVKPESASAV